MEFMQGARISKHWAKKSMLALQDSRDQEVPSPGTLLKLILAANRARSVRGKRNIKQKGLNRHRAVHKKPSRGSYGWRNQAEVAHKSSKMTQKRKEREDIVRVSARERCQQ